MIVSFIDMIYFYGEMPWVWGGDFCETTECDCTMAMGGEAEFESGGLREPCRMFRNFEAFFDALK